MTRTSLPESPAQAVFGAALPGGSFGPEGHRISRADIAPVLRELNVLQPWRTFASIALEWSILAGTILAALHLDAWWAYLLAVPIIGTRQHALTVLMHEGAHYRASRSRFLNDWVVDIFCALPLGPSLPVYRHVHRAHHRHLNTERDPDHLAHMASDQYRFPMSRARFLGILLGDLIGLGSLAKVRDISFYWPWRGGRGWRSWLTRGGRSTDEVMGHGDRIRTILFFLAVPLAFLAGAIALKVIGLWMVPYLTILTFCLRVRSVAEHRGCANNHELDATRHVDASWWERLGICPRNIQYHIAHHMFPSVPYYNLPRLHAALMAMDAYPTEGHFSQGYGLRGVTGEITTT
jgi:fatty acid desaturase